MCCLYLRPPCVCRSLTQSPVPTSLQRGKSAAAVSSRMQHLRPRMLKSEALLTPQTRVKAQDQRCRDSKSLTRTTPQKWLLQYATKIHCSPAPPRTREETRSREARELDVLRFSGLLTLSQLGQARRGLGSRAFCPRPAEQSRTQGTRPNSTEKDPRKDMNSEQTSPAAGST